VSGCLQRPTLSMEREWRTVLTLDDGATKLGLAEEEQVLLGRKHMRPSFAGVVLVAREQCRVSRPTSQTSGGAPQMRVESLGCNPTLILRSNGKKEILEKGDTVDVGHGDKIALLCKAPEMAITVSCAPADGGIGVEGKPRWPVLQATRRKRPSPETASAGSPSAQQAAGSRCHKPPGGAGSKIPTGVARNANVRNWPVVLIMVGTVGSGKTTFAQALVDEHPHHWSRVCQDIVRGGKSGTRQQCLAALSRAIADGKSVVVDRCNLDAGQRADFVALAKASQASVHSVVLQLPNDVTALRAGSRKNHEGGLNGATAAKVSRIMSGKMRKQEALPSKSEGFSHITKCTNDLEVAKALSTWMTWTASNALPLPSPTETTQAGGEGSPLIGALAAGPAEGGEDAAEGLASGGQSSRPTAQLGASASEIPSPKSAFDIMMGSAGRQTRRSSKGQRPPVAGHQKSSAQGSKQITFHRPWSERLWQVAQSPSSFLEEYPELQQFSLPVCDDVAGSCVLILDKFPKARKHLLVLSTNPQLESIEDLRREHIPELRHMAMRGRQWAEEQRSQHPELPGFKMGFHTIPSMRQLHLHVISLDFDSPCLKNKKHWNSFTTGFFREVDGVISELEAKGCVHIDLQEAKSLVAAEMVCHRCGNPFRNMPSLKGHLSNCSGGG